MKKIVIASLFALFIGSVDAATTIQKSPLLLEGKQNLYQRVLTVPGALLAASPKAADAGKPTTPFTAYYVYKREQAGKQEWLQVGTDRHGTINGWVPASQTLEWNQGLTVAFRDPVDRDRSLLFRDGKDLQALVESRDLNRYQQLYAQAERGSMDAGSPVVAIQPKGHVDIQEDFYLVPIHKHQDVYMGSEQARMLQVSSVPLSYAPPTAKAKAEAKPAKAPAAPQLPGRDQYSAGIVFAIDSTKSMDPYIDRTRKAVMKIYDSLKRAGLMGNVSFGLVSFRDNQEAVPEIEYLTRTYVTLEQGSEPQTFIDNVEGLSAATVSSQDFQEDAYAGVKQAIEEMNWKGQHARYIVLVTDAGPRGEKDPLSSIGMSAEGLQQLAWDNGVAIFVLHLLTPDSEADHETAAEQYKRLSQFPGIGSLYYGVPTGDVDKFGRALDTLAGQITMQVKVAASNATPSQPQPVATTIVRGDAELEQLQEKVAKLGYALRMRYLQKHANDQVPNVFNAWLVDRDFRNPERRTLDVRVLLTRDQLSDLHDILKKVLNTAEEGLLSPKNFLNELKSLAATISRDPEELGTTTATTAGQGNSLADLGFMMEYISDLPYTPEVMNISLEDWHSWSATEQIRFLHKLEAKINYYRALHDHTDLWVSLDGGPVDGDSVFPIALDMLP